MKITKSQLKKLIKEELEVTLTNEEAGEMFGENIEAQLNEIEDLMTDAEKLRLLFDALVQIGYNFSPAALGALVVYFLQKAMGMHEREDVEAAAQEAIKHKAGEA